MTETYSGYPAGRRRTASGADWLSYLVITVLLGLRLASAQTADIA